MCRSSIYKIQGVVDDIWVIIDPLCMGDCTVELVDCEGGIGFEVYAGWSTDKSCG